MRATMRSVALLAGALAVTGLDAAAQDQPTAMPAVSVPLRVQLVISRYQGDKKITAVPFTFLVNATEVSNRLEEPSRVRMGVEGPITTYVQSPDAKPNAPTGQSPVVQYRPFGTNIDCVAKILDNGRFK